jgi:excinuclease ABC subunit C
MREKTIYQDLPATPGVYLMKGIRGKVLYIGKAGNLRRRVASYYLRANDAKTEKLLTEVKKIDYQETDTAIEALILESKLIKKYQPPYNIKEKDDKSFLYVVLTKEKFPRLLLVRGKTRPALRLAEWGPFTSASHIRQALKIVRRIFPFNLHQPSQVGRASRPCFDYEIGLCPGTCAGLISPKDYLKNIRNIRLFFNGRKLEILRKLEEEMARASRELKFEAAARIRRQIFALRHIQDIALITEPEFKTSDSVRPRIEGYDISNISGTSAVGSMVVFVGSTPVKSEYRRFRIRTVVGADDVAMLKEVLRRRFRHSWPLPDLVLIDGGRGQVNAAKSVLAEFGLKIPVVGLAKGPTRKRNEFIGILPGGLEKGALIKLRDEAHRFALRYHRTLRHKKFRE